MVLPPSGMRVLVGEVEDRRGRRGAAGCRRDALMRHACGREQAGALVFVATDLGRRDVEIAVVVERVGDRGREHRGHEASAASHQMCQIMAKPKSRAEHREDEAGAGVAAACGSA